MPRGATRIAALRLGKICGYSNSENSEGEMDRKKKNLVRSGTKEREESLIFF